ncbi:HNH endonuclease signature motif containing protein [Halarcobacter sp.]|uniref:HNH endonuclease n=1 Tax=Halarcobacter sp. TaxID=2321133 RepID=UPI002AA770B2|nr:HNH endonuclease signature motif containing protein [Halarcobacter sp.]
MRVTKKIKEQLLKQAEGKCEYCGIELDERTAMVDHKIPLSQGGSSDIENLAISCPKCNILKADKILGSISNPVVESAAKLWIHAFLKSPKITSISSIVSVIAVVLTIYQTEIIRKEKLEAKLSENLDFKSQIKELSETEKSLKTLLTFVSSQKQKVIIYEQNIQQLENEKQKLEPLVNADKATVEALFKVQEERAKENANKERWIGFGLGILASIIASFVMVIGRYFFVSRQENS